MINDHISDMFTRLSNAYAVGKKTVDMPFTKMCEAVAGVMLEEKYLRKVELVSPDKTHSTLRLTLSYRGSTPAVSQVSVFTALSVSSSLFYLVLESPFFLLLPVLCLIVKHALLI